jgi:hypothetical protein
MMGLREFLTRPSIRLSKFKDEEPCGVNSLHGREPAALYVFLRIAPDVEARVS